MTKMWNMIFSHGPWEKGGGPDMCIFSRNEKNFGKELITEPLLAKSVAKRWEDPGKEKLFLPYITHIFSLELKKIYCSINTQIKVHSKFQIFDYR